MNPRLLNELDAEGSAIMRDIDAIPRGREHDMTGHIDAKKAVCRRFAALMKRWREEAGGQRAAPLFAGQSGKTLFPTATPRRRA